MNDTELAIIKVLKKGIPIRARGIAKSTGSTRKEINQYLYTSLKELVHRDIYYRWKLKSNLSIEKFISSEKSAEVDSDLLEKMIQEHQNKTQIEEFERTLESLIRSSEN